MKDGDVNNRHLIYSYLVESTGIFEVFKAVSEDLYIYRRLLKLKVPGEPKVPGSPGNPQQNLLDNLNAAIDLLYKKPESLIAPSFEEQRLNAYWTMFGYTIRGKEKSFKRTSYYNATFHKKLEDSLFQTAQILLDNTGPVGGITTEHTGNPEALARLLNDLKEMAENRKYNFIAIISNASALAFDLFLTLLDDQNPLPQPFAQLYDMLNLTSPGKHGKLTELAELYKVPIVKDPFYYLRLAEQMEALLETIEKVPGGLWKSDNINQITDDKDFLLEFFANWYQITGKDIIADAFKMRRPK